MNIVVKNCKLPSVAEIAATGKTLTPVSYAKTRTLYENRDKVWAYQAVASQAVMTALLSVEHEAEAQAKEKAARIVAPAK
jgi:hypothetical protein